jgi:TonB family protein
VPDKANKTPDYPSELRDEGIEGEVVLKLHVYRDGTVKGAKILRVTSTATGDEANETITIWLMQTIPFKLTGGG